MRQWQRRLGVLHHDRPYMPLAEITVNAENIHGRFRSLAVTHTRTLPKNVSTELRGDRELFGRQAASEEGYTVYSNIIRTDAKQHQTCHITSDRNTNTEYHITHMSRFGDGTCVGIRTDRHDVRRIRSSFALSDRTREANVRRRV
jgi:hypothetical protein